MSFRVNVYLGFGNSYEEYFNTLEEARVYQKEKQAEGGPKHFVTIQQLVTEWKEI